MLSYFSLKPDLTYINIYTAWVDNRAGLANSLCVYG